MEAPRHSCTGYFYFDYKDQLQQTAEVLLSSLLKQMAHPLEGLHPCLKSIYDQVSPGSAKPVLSDLVNLFITCAQHLKTVFVILDAFDECGQQSRIIEHIIKRFSLSGIKVFITARPHLHETFKSEFDRATFFTITAEDDDVKNYITSELQTKKKRLNDNFRKEIIYEISSRAQGM